VIITVCLLIEGVDRARFIMSQSIRLLRHVERMDGNAILKRVLTGRLYSKRRNGKPGTSWLEVAESHVKMMKVKAVETGCSGGQGSARTVVPNGSTVHSISFYFIKFIPKAFFQGVICQVLVADNSHQVTN
jgi:hypothetical protein